MSVQGPSLLDVVRKGDIDQARNILGNGIDPNITDSSEIKPLHYAVQGNHFSVIELLVEYGADPNAKENSGSTSLHYAARDGHTEIIQLLLDYGADPNSKENKGLTPLHIAAKGNEVSAVKLLLHAGAKKEMEDNEGNIPLHLVAQQEIARLLLDLPTIDSHPAKVGPLFPIKINENILIPSTLSAGPLKTKHILVQTSAGLTSSKRQDLEEADLKHFDYVSKNTYLFEYQGKDLEKIRKMEPFVYVNIYPKELKITPQLKEAKNAEPDREYEVDIIYHKGVDSKSPDLQRDIEKESHNDKQDIQFLSNKARLSILGRHLDGLASIEDVYRIEEVLEVVEYNDAARQILKIDSQSSNGKMLHYEGKGQVIAVADSGLHHGADGPLHHAFQNCAIGWIAEHNYTVDLTGHGTHVCGSAVGKGLTLGGDNIMGAAPQAGLLVQSIWDPLKGAMNPPSTLTTLFDSPYMLNARVHSNSWGTSRRKSNTSILRQIGYNDAAEMIDKFVCENPDMVICFAAGNDGRESVDSQDQGQIGSQAGAKNCITVGASQSSRPGYDPGIIADFSSRGPTTSGFFKPDVVAPGETVLSATSGRILKVKNPYPTDGRWHYMKGTSMATPLVAGCAAVLREALIKRRPNSKPRYPTAALIKVLLVNGAEILPVITGRFVPDARSGFGRVNMANTIKIVHCDHGTGFRELEVADGLPWEETLSVDPKYSYTTLKATLVWSDPPGPLIKNKLRLGIKNAGRRNFAISSNNVQQIVHKNIMKGDLKVKVDIVGNLYISPQPFAVAWQLS